MSKWKIAALLGLGVLLLGTIGVGLFFKHYFVVFVFSVWMGVEYTLWKVSIPERVRRKTYPIRFRSLASLVELYGDRDTVSETVVEQTIAELKRSGNLSDLESRWLFRLRDLLELRGLVLNNWGMGRRMLRQGFAINCEGSSKNKDLAPNSVSRQDVIEGATHVADLYLKLFEMASGEYPDLSLLARDLYERIFREPFELDKSRRLIDTLTDSIQRDEGVPFLVLNLLKTGHIEFARKVTHSLLQEDESFDSETLTTLYWLGETIWFAAQEKSPIQDHESTIRYLYHLCFTNPERGGFLEIDSRFFSQFQSVSDLAKEGFLYKEALVERVLGLWRDQQSYFDPVFKEVLQLMTQKENKIYDDRESWDLLWKREQENFSKDYLYLVEGNLFYADGNYRDALTCYEKALRENPKLRSARFNLLFCFAHLGMKERHRALTETLVADRSLWPAALYNVSDSLLLVGDEEASELYFHLLSKVEGWEKKVDYYRSTFCYENGLFKKALVHAKRAKELNPHDSTIAYHLSLCFNAVGEKNEALRLVQSMNETANPEWLNYYRFTLERDSGLDAEASKTLLKIPHDYFEDAEELEAALDFAKRRQDLSLLRHLRKSAAQMGSDE